MTKKKVMEKAKANFELQLQDDLCTMSVDGNVAQDRAKMHEMEKFMNDLIDADESDVEEEQKLAQAKIDELAASRLD